MRKRSGGWVVAGESGTEDRRKKGGAPETNRTSDLPLRRGLLYPLSYRGEPQGSPERDYDALSPASPTPRDFTGSVVPAYTRRVPMFNRPASHAEPRRASAVRGRRTEAART